MVRVIVAGATGRVGQAMMAGLSGRENIELLGGFGSEDRDRAAELLTRADVLVDFTTAAAAPGILVEAVRAGVRPVSGTTGMPADTLQQLDAELRERGIGGVWAPNFAIGAALMMHFAELASKFMDAAEIIELHHDQKADAPSGTAVATARMIRDARQADLPDPPVERWTLPGARGAVDGGVRIHSVRLPGLSAHQEVIFGAQGQTLRIRHDSIGRDSFVPGVLLAIDDVQHRIGLVHGLATLMGLP